MTCSILSAQDQVDALRYSQWYPGGTARSIAMGGAFGALGDDFGSISQNPAGLGVYRSSELTFSPELFHSKVNSTYLGQKETDDKFNFNLNNFGYVSAFKGNKIGIKGGSFAIGFNRLNNFSSNTYLQGNNKETSLGDAFAESANNGGNPVSLDNLAPFTEGLFYDAGVIYQDSTGFYQLNPDLYLTGQVNSIQSQSVSRSGRISEWVFAGGFNLNDKVYLGASFGILPVRYIENSHFVEEDANHPGYQYFDYEQNLDVSGFGFSGKFGIILRPVQFLRLGASIHTPIAYSLSENYTASMTSQYASGRVYPLNVNGNRNNYDIISPYKAVGSIGFILGKVAILSADLEYVDYSSMRLRNGSNGYSFTYENQTIRDIYKPAYNLKTGAELRMGDTYFRGGFDYYGSPYQSSELNANAYTLGYSAGIGFRQKGFFMDFAWSLMQHNEYNVLYTAFNNNYTAYQKSNTTRFTTTFGFRF